VQCHLIVSGSYCKKFIVIGQWYLSMMGHVYYVAVCNTITSTVRCERQSARMSKITNDGLTRSGTGCFIAVSIW